MKIVKYVWLALRALYELARYDMTNAVRGPGNIPRRLGRQPITCEPYNCESVQTTCDAVLLAACLYWKPVLCLQRSACIVRLLRKQGIVARLVIGCRTKPFFSHAWAEVDGRIVNDSPTYQERLHILYKA
ncbi:MAG: lasso peptide biosynthesis B2 protein [Acidobacteria bacterium]|nr:lasso peptide biosynthesis B2 protein [Acidobacteriota bacterium]